MGLSQVSAATNTWDIEVKIVGPDDVEHSIASSISAELAQPAIEHTAAYLIDNSKLVVMKKMGLNYK